MTKTLKVLLPTLTGVSLLAMTVACGSNARVPSAPAPASPAAAAPVASASADLAACLGGSGDAACFSGAGRVSSTTVRAQATSSPTTLTATVTGTTVILQWTAPVIGTATSYTIEASSTPNGPANLANFNTGNSLTSLTVPGVPAGVYYVRVRAIDASGASIPSNEVTVIVGGASAPGGCPSAPRSLIVTSQTAGTISLAWSGPASGSATSYTIRAGSAPGLSNLADFATGNASLSFVATGVPAGSYYVRVYSSAPGCALSGASNEVLVFVVGFTGDVQVSVSWDAPSDVDLHVVEPSGNEVYYGNTTSSTGGQLDVDSNPACNIDGRQIENIRWNSRAPAGTYIVRVDYYEGCGVARTNYLVTVKNGASVQTFSGFFTGSGDFGGRGSGVTITTFSHAASLVADKVVEQFRAPQLFVPSAKKLSRIAGAE